MEICEYFSSDRKDVLLSALERCEWAAAKFLVQLLSENAFEKTLGKGRLYFLKSGEHAVSFLTLNRSECVFAPGLTPWIGYLYTFPEFRGHRYAGFLLEAARKAAENDGFPFVFLSTDHSGLYEKYGFTFLENRKNAHSGESRIYFCRAKNILDTSADALRCAEAILSESRIMEIWKASGAKVNLVGSTAMGLLMKHRDIDLHVYTDTLNPAESFRILAQIAANPAVTRVEFRNLAATEEACLEWHLQYQKNGEMWQIDIIQILRGSRYDGFFEQVAESVKAALTPEIRQTILELKYLTPDTEHIMGIDYYRAVIEGGVRTFRDFKIWRKFHPSEGIVTWCPGGK